jgi:hypothetical protein
LAFRADDPVHEAPRVRRGGADDLGGERKALRAADAGMTRDAPHADAGKLCPLLWE